MKKRRAVMAAVAVVCAGVIAVGLSGCEWFSLNGRRNMPTSVSDTLGYYGDDTAAWLTSESKSPLELRHEEYEAAIAEGWFTRDEVSFIDYLKAMKEDSASLSSSLRASVLIQTTSNTGSGVIYSINKEANEDGSKNAYVITNNHVISGGKAYYTYLYGDKYDMNAILPTALEATKIGGSASEDIAVLSVKIPEDRLDYALSICDNVGTRDSDKAKAGETIYAIGNTLGYGISVVSGTIGMEVENSDIVSHLSMRIDASVTHGNSGGGLFDRDGKLVGIVYGGLDSTVQMKNDKNQWVESTISIAGFGWAIPVNRALSVAQSIIDNYKNPESTEAKGVATCGILGTLKIESSKGVFNPLTQTVDIVEEVMIANVPLKSPFYGDAANIRGKILKSIVAKNKDGKTVDLEITRLHQIETVLFNIRNGDTVTLKFTDGTSVSATYLLNDEANHFEKVN